MRSLWNESAKPWMVFYGLAADPAGSRGILSEPLEGLGDARSNIGWQFPERLGGQGQLDPIRIQPRSLRSMVRPLA
jgi:hypothetical protein